MKKLGRWLYWNSANILSASRYFSILIPLEIWDWSVETTLAIIVALGATDLLDGWVARKIGNFRGVGKAIDTSADKIMILSVSIWILRRLEDIDSKIIWAIILGEMLPFFIGLCGIGLAWKKNRNRGFSVIAKEVWRRWKVNEAGRKAMVFYFAMAIFIFWQTLFSENPAFKSLYLAAFLGGFILRIISSRLYIVDLNNWIKEYKTKV